MAKSNAVIRRFAEEHNLTESQVRRLLLLAERASNAQERIHNTNPKNKAEERDLGYQADKSMTAFTVFATTECHFGGVDWTGLYPTVSKQGKRFISLPE